MSHHSYNDNGEGISHKDPLSRILDELSFLKLWKEKIERTNLLELETAERGGCSKGVNDP